VPGTGIILLAALAALAWWLLTPGGGEAAEFKSGAEPEIKSGETIEGDLYLVGGDAKVAGRVSGDAVASTGSLDVSGRIDGSLSVLSGEVTVSGQIGRSLRVIGGKVTVTGSVDGDIVLAGGRVDIEKGAVVNGDVASTAGEMHVLAPIGGDIRGKYGNLTIDAAVGGDVDVTVSDLNLKSGARIAGDLDYTSRREADKQLGAVVSGSTDHTTQSRFYPGDNVASWFGSPLFRLLCALATGIVLILLIPGAMTAVADGVRTAPAGSFLLGLGLTIGIPILSVILMVTVVGIPLAALLFVAYLGVLYLSQIFVGLALGRLVMPRSWDTHGRGYNLLAMTIGVVVLAALRMAPVPFLGFAVAALTAIFALGAVVLGPRRARNQPVSFA
jgi:cytoskeletal protein CcmA (bactofilin family)